MTYFTRVLTIAGLCGLLLAATATDQARGEEKPDTAKSARLFELRIYTTHPGKLDDLNKRFREHTNRIFQKHGMELVGYWVPQDKEDTLIYILAYPNMEARQKAWQGFRDDPEWKAAFAASRANGPLVMKVESKFMTPTDYSPIR